MTPLRLNYALLLFVSLLHFRFVHATNLVQKRDTQDIASACGSSCSPIQNIMANCPDAQLECLCTEAFDAGLLSCLNCLTGALSETQSIMSSIQKNMDGFVSNCKSNGTPITGYKLGQTPPASASTQTTPEHSSSIRAYELGRTVSVLTNLYIGAGTLMVTGYIFRWSR